MDLQYYQDFTLFCEQQHHCEMPTHLIHKLKEQFTQNSFWNELKIKETKKETSEDETVQLWMCGWMMMGNKTCFSVLFQIHPTKQVQGHSITAAATATGVCALWDFSDWSSWRRTDILGSAPVTVEKLFHHGHVAFMTPVAPSFWIQREESGYSSMSCDNLNPEAETRREDGNMSQTCCLPAGSQRQVTVYRRVRSLTDYYITGEGWLL